MANLATATDYAVLRKRVRETLLLGQARIEEEKVRTYWQTGRYIDDHILRHKERADYEKQVIFKLSKDVGVSDASLYEILKFVRAFPIFHTCGKLSWSVLRKIAIIPDANKRLELVRKAAKEGWVSDEALAKVKRIRLLEFKPNQTFQPLSMPRLGDFWNYRVIRPDLIRSKSKVLLIDLGFKVTIETDRFPGERFSADAIVKSIKDSKGNYSFETVDDKSATEGLFTYQAYVERVIDGDTLKVEIDLGFHNRFRETIRLKYLDAPELDTREGKVAKKFVEDELMGLESVVIKSTKSEKWGRWLGDVFYAHPKTKDLIYLNQLLLDRRLAVRMRV